MDVNEGNLQVIDVDVILESCPMPIVILNLLVHNNTTQYSRVCVCFLPIHSGHQVR